MGVRSAGRRDLCPVAHIWDLRYPSQPMIQGSTTTSRKTAPRRRIAVLTHSYYEEDPRVRREAETLAAAGHEVDVFALRRPDDLPSEVIAGVAVRRLDVQRHQGEGIRVYLAEYLSFFARAAVALTRSHATRRYRLVQVHTLPDFLVFATLPLRLVGVPVILDLHEAMPVFFATRFGTGRGGRLARWLLDLQERLAVRYASAVVTVNDALGDRLASIGVPADKLTIIANSPSLARFDPSRVPNRPFMADGTLRLVYAGALSPIYELDVAVEAIGRLARLRPDLPVRLDLYGRDFDEVPLADQVERAGLTDRVIFHGRIPIDAVPAVIAEGDVGIAPTRSTTYTQFSLSTKVYEYAAMRRAVVASRLPMVDRTFGDTVETYTPGDADDLADVLLSLVDGAEARDARIERASELVCRLSWEAESDRLLALVDRLTERHRARA